MCATNSRAKNSDCAQQENCALSNAAASSDGLAVDASDFLAALTAAIRSLGLSGARVLVGVSGGADSVALLRGLHALTDPERLQIVAAHLNHGMRTGAAAADAAWTDNLCRQFGIPFVLEGVDVPAYARQHGLNFEEAARDVRYEFFARAARTANCTHVVVGHTADDQVETVLHHLFRGTGLAGLQGMPASRPLADGLTLARPMLGIERARLRAFLSAIGQDFRTDATNLDESRSRNRLRLTVLPELVRALGPQVIDSIQRTADRVREAQSTIEDLAEELLTAALVDQSPELVRLDADVLAGARRHLVREAFVVLWKRQSWPRQATGFESWDRLWQLVQAGGSANLPGPIEATRRGKLVVLRRRS